MDMTRAPHSTIRLGVNIDHVADHPQRTRRPPPRSAARVLTLRSRRERTASAAHLREDRRHISDTDIARLKSELTRPLNLEMAATAEMVAIALRHVPNACCLVPERREERTTEGGLDIVGQKRSSSRSSPNSRPPAFASRCSSSPTAAPSRLRRGRRGYRRASHGRYCEFAADDNSKGAAAEMRASPRPQPKLQPSGWRSTPGTG